MPAFADNVPRSVNDLFPVMVPPTCTELLLGAGRSLDLNQELQDLKSLSQSETNDLVFEQQLEAFLSKYIMYARSEGLILEFAEDSLTTLRVVPDQYGHPLGQLAAQLEPFGYAVLFKSKFLFDNSLGQLVHEDRVLHLSPELLLKDGGLWEVVRHELQHLIESLLDDLARAPTFFGMLRSENDDLTHDKNFYEDELHLDEINAYLISLRSLIEQVKAFEAYFETLDSEFDRVPVRKVIDALEERFAVTLDLAMRIAEAVEDNLEQVDKALQRLSIARLYEIDMTRLDGKVVAVVDDLAITLKASEEGEFYTATVQYAKGKTFETRKFELTQQQAHRFFRSRVTSRRALLVLIARVVSRHFKPMLEFAPVITDSLEILQEAADGGEQLLQPAFEDTLEALLSDLGIAY
ncbi:MAG: hypothetical protein HRT45_01895 [Bdellovibrionales bacterium]|nr:hypothetical protein [Bdellovibrionales bacterium]